MSNITLDDLADMIQKEFSHINGRLDGHDQQFKHIDKRFDKVESDSKVLRDGQEQIKLRQDNIAYRFEVRDLDKRVTVLEEKAKFA